MSARMKAAVVLAAMLGSAAWGQAPQKLAYQGLLLKVDGTPETGTQPMRFSVHDALTAGTELWSESQNIMLTQGYYATVLGGTTAIPASVFDGSERYLEIAVNGTPLTPRMHIVSVPYALRAGRAEVATNLAGGTVNATSVSVNGTPVIDTTGALVGNTAYAGVNGVTVNGRNIGLRNCAAGDILRWDTGTSSWVCSTYVAPSGDAGVVAYTADPNGGLVLMGADFTAFSLRRTCASNQVLKWNGTAWACANDTDTNTTYGAAAGQGLATSGAGSTLFGLQDCPSGEVLRSGGGNWACAADSDTQYTAAVNGGLVLNGNAFGLLGCTSGQVMKATSTSGEWTCAADSDTIAGAGSMGGLTKVGNNFHLQNCSVGEVLKYVAANQWACRADNSSVGTVTSITAGTGLTGGIITGSGTIALDPLVPNWTAFMPATCGAGQALRSIALDGTPVCEPIASAGTVTSIVGAGGVITSPDAGITTTGTISLAPTVQNWTTGQPTCLAGQAIQSIGANGLVSCITVSLDGGTGGGSVTQVASGAGLAGGPITGSGTLYIPNAGVTNAMLQNSAVTVSPGTGLTGGGSVALGGTVTLSLSTPVTLANGGTGSTTADGARTAILAAARGANSDITSLSALSTPLSVGQGGTGSSTQNFVDLTSTQSIDGTKTFNATIQGSITGNAGSVTNGVYSTGSYADPSWITSIAGNKVGGNIGGNAAGFTGSLAGDVTGLQGSTTVGKLQGRPVSSVNPNVNQLLGWNGTTWVPTSVTGTLPVVVSANTISLAPCTTGQVLKADGGTWICAEDDNSGTVTSVTAGRGLWGGTITSSGTIAIADGGVTNTMLANPSITVSPGTGLSGGGTVALGGTLTLGLSTPVSVANGGTGSSTQNFVDLSTAQTIAGTKTFSAAINGTLNGNASTVTNGVYTTGTYADPAWITSLAGSKVTGNISGNAAGFTGNLAGDVTGPQATTVVARLQGYPVLSTAPANGQALVYGTTAPVGWRAVSPAGDLAGSFLSTRVVALQNTTVAATPPTSGQVLQFSAGAGAWVPTTFAEGDGVIGNEVTNTANATLVRSGAGTSASPFQLSLNLANANSWTDTQTFEAGAKVGDGRLLDMAGVSSLRFNSTVSTTTPMLYMFAAGEFNGTRPVIGHSPTYPEWGLVYDDDNDAFRFQQSSTTGPPALRVDLGSTQVSVGGSPFGTSALTVTGATYLNGTTYVNSAATVNGNLTANGNATVNNNATVWGTTYSSGLLTAATGLRVNGLTRMGSEAGNYDPPRVDSTGGYQGMVVRRINSSAPAFSTGVARTDVFQLRRIGGTDDGFDMVKLASNSERGYIACQGTTTGGAYLARAVNAPAGDPQNTVYPVFAAGTGVMFITCQFGSLDAAFSPERVWHHTNVSMARTNTGDIWVGTLTSTYNQ